MPFPKCMLPVGQELIFIQVSHDILAYHMFKQLTWHACQRHGAIITSKSPIPFLKEGTNVFKRFHPYQEIVGTNVQIFDLVRLLAPLELHDEAHQILRPLRDSSLWVT